VKVVYLIFMAELALEKGESEMGEGSLARGTAGKIFTLHKRIIGGGTAEEQAVAVIIGANAHEIAAPGYLSLEVVDARGFITRAGGLVVRAVFVQPGDGEGIGTAVIDKRLMAVVQVFGVGRCWQRHGGGGR
jgi:hypothetical protein